MYLLKSNLFSLQCILLKFCKNNIVDSFRHISMVRTDHNLANMSIKFNATVFSLIDKQNILNLQWLKKKGGGGGLVGWLVLKCVGNLVIKYLNVT